MPSSVLQKARLAVLQSSKGLLWRRLLSKGRRSWLLANGNMSAGRSLCFDQMSRQIDGCCHRCMFVMQYLTNWHIAVFLGRRVFSERGQKYQPTGGKEGCFLSPFGSFFTSMNIKYDVLRRGYFQHTWSNFPQLIFPHLYLYLKPKTSCIQLFIYIYQL